MVYFNSRAASHQRSHDAYVTANITMTLLCDLRGNTFMLTKHHPYHMLELRVDEPLNEPYRSVEVSRRRDGSIYTEDRLTLLGLLQPCRFRHRPSSL